MTPEQITLVQESFAKVEPIADKAAELFYGKLFELDPSLKPMFKGDIAEQGTKLMTMIGGETPRVESKFGEALSAGTVGGQVMLSIGAFYGTPDGSITSIDNGSVYNVVLKD